jgi:magnesium-transporting ATPase (P-type)
VCHSVLPSEKNGRVEFQAASPDELALVEAAVDQQYFFHEINPVRTQFHGLTIEGTEMKVNICGREEVFTVFELIEFDSARKRMSLICFDNRDRKVKIYCKGADNVIRERCTPASLAHSWSSTNKYLQEFSRIGLRTLCCAYRVIPEDEFVRWYEGHTKAKSSMANRKAEIEASEALIEKDLTLLGATAIEDRLQEGVPEAIASLAKAGLKIWVLTGDKIETAINIGRSCKLLTEAMRGPNLAVIDIDESLDEHAARVCLTTPHIILYLSEMCS